MAIFGNLEPPDWQCSDIKIIIAVWNLFYCNKNAIIAIFGNQALPFLHALGNFCHYFYFYGWYVQISQFRIFRFFRKESNICFRISRKSNYAEKRHVYSLALTFVKVRIDKAKNNLSCWSCMVKTQTLKLNWLTESQLEMLPDISYQGR